MIIKIERPRETGDQVPMAFIRDRQRNLSVRIPFAEVEPLFNERERQIYCRARLDNGHLDIGRKLRPQLF